MHNLNSGPANFRQIECTAFWSESPGKIYNDKHEIRLQDTTIRHYTKNECDFL